MGTGDTASGISVLDETLSETDGNFYWNRSVFGRTFSVGRVCLADSDKRKQNNQR